MVLALLEQEQGGIGLAVDQYIFENINKNPEQMGIPIVETLTASTDGTVYVDTNNAIAKQLTDDSFIVSYSDYAGVTGGVEEYGIIYIENITTSSYLGSGDVSSTTGNTQTAENRIYFDSNVSDEDTLEVAYFALGRGYSSGGSSDQTETLLRPDKTYTNSYEVREEIYRALINAMDYKSPINLAEAGWKYADRMFYDEYDMGGVGSGEDEEILDTDDSGLIFSPPRDESFPFIITEISVTIPEDETDNMVPNVSLEVDAQFDRDSTDKKDVGEGETAGTPHDRIPFRWSRIVYKSGDNGYRMKIRWGMVKTNRSKIYLYMDEAWPDGEGQDDDVAISISGYYMPIWGGDEP